MQGLRKLTLSVVSVYSKHLCQTNNACNRTQLYTIIIIHKVVTSPLAPGSIHSYDILFAWEQYTSQFSKEQLHVHCIGVTGDSHFSTAKTTIVKLCYYKFQCYCCVILGTLVHVCLDVIYRHWTNHNS
jgi:hypothetical protein